MYEDIRASANGLAQRLVDSREGRASVIAFRRALELQGHDVDGLSDSDVADALALCIVRDAPELFPTDANPLTLLGESFPHIPSAKVWVAYRSMRTEDLVRIPSGVQHDNPTGARQV